MKLQMQQEKDGRKLGYGAMQGIPMVASSPVRHDSPLNLHGLEVTSYQPPWKTLSDFALNADLDNNTMITHNNPAFQQLYNQVGQTNSELSSPSVVPFISTHLILTTYSRHILM